ncbi:MAG TPA: diaminopimelate epimerase [Thermoanaerobaculia bacterium]|nr:diaminopimelate epimerase [Thermoanaerobaculia bacterium]
MTELYRTSGAGNDFLALAEPTAPPAPEIIRAWCARGVSLGADGVFTIRRVAGDADAPTAINMVYWNADGGEAALCVNATRCAAQLAFHLGFAKSAVTVNTGSGPFAARQVSADEIELEMAPPNELPREARFDDAHQGWALTVGVPHAVLPWDDDLARCPVAELGRFVRRHEQFGGAGANANFVRFPSPHELEIRTFERGVEAETLACGSGVLASVLVGVWIGKLELPVRARTKGGFVLTVDGEVGEDGRRIARWTMAGDARVLARVDTFPGAEQLLPAPLWEPAP